MSGKAEKKYVCNVEGRRFTTAEGLAAHRATVHRSTPTSARGSYRGRGRSSFRGRGRGFRARGASRSVFSSREPASFGTAITVSGEDRLDEFTIGSAVYKSYLVVPTFSPRLTSLAAAYQRINWIRLSIVITPQAATTINGGYVAGFVMDADDGSVTARQLTANRGTITRKIFESGVVHMPRNNTSFYTSSGTEERLVSPGRFWLIVEQEPSAKIYCTVTALWTVRLHAPSVENATTNYDTNLNRYELWSKQGNYNLQCKNSKGEVSDDCTPIFGHLPDPTTIGDKYMFFRVPSFAIEWAEGTGDTGTIVMHFVAYKPHDKRCYYSINGRDIDTTSWQANLDTRCLVPLGTLMRYVGTGNDYPAVSVAHHALRSPDFHQATLQAFSETLNQLRSQVEKLSTSSRRNSIDSSSGSSISMITKLPQQE